jgi:hypothetical protein
MSPYQEALQWINKHPGTGSASSLAKLILSLWSDDCGFSIRECTGNLDAHLSDLALRVVAHFLKVGENQDLVQVGHEVVEKYPRLWETSKAMAGARQEKRTEWRIADEAESARLYPNG